MAIKKAQVKKSGKTARAGKVKKLAVKSARKPHTPRPAKGKGANPRSHAQGAKKAVVKALKKKPIIQKENRPAGIPEKLRDAAMVVLNERKAEDILTFDLTGRSAMADYLIIASGRASKQLVALAHHLGDAFAKLGVAKPRIEGMQDANWVLVDAGDVIVHLFRPEVRHYYDLEAIWKDQ